MTTSLRLRGIALLLVAVLMMVLLAACGDDDDDGNGSGDVTSTTAATAAAGTATTAGNATEPASGDTGTPDAGDQALTKVSVALDWYPWSNHTGFYMALANDYFKAEGLDVNIYVPSDPTTALQLIAAGKDDFTISYQADVLLARSQGLEVKSVAALVQHPLNTIMALESSNITTAEDLAGKKIGITGVPSDEALLGTVLEEAGLTTDDVEMVNVGFDLMPALLSGQVDAIIGGYWVHESILAEQQGSPVTALRVEELGVPDYYELLLVTSDKLVNESPDMVAGFMRALAKGYADAAANPGQAIDELVAAYPETSEDVEREGIQLIIPYWTDDGAVAWGTQTEERWNSYADWLRDTGILTDDVNVSEAWTNQFIEQ